MSEFLEHHWSFGAAAVIFYAIGETMKLGPLGAERAREVEFVRLIRRWFPLPLHPIVAGVVLGLIPGIPLSVEREGLSAPLYYAAAGAVSVVYRNILREWQKFKVNGED